MIGLRTILDVADNSGAKRISLIKVLGGPQNALFRSLGDNHPSANVKGGGSRKGPCGRETVVKPWWSGR